MKFEDTNLSDINLNVLRLSNIYRDRGHCDIETLKQEDSNSGGSLQIGSQINDIYQQTNGGSNHNPVEESNNLKNEENASTANHINGIIKDQSPKQLYSTQSQSNEGSLVVLSHTEDWFYCEICGTSCINKTEFETHYDSHFYKCKTCLAVFTSTESLDAHSEEVHYMNERCENVEAS